MTEEKPLVPGTLAAASRDLGLAPTPWRFDEDVTRAFDDMLERSIPQYDVMRRWVADVANRYVKAGMWIVDLGCSRGEALVPLVAQHGARNKFMGVELSEPMLDAARKRFEGYIDAGVVRINRFDLRREYPQVPSCVTLAILTLQFVPIEHRQRIVRSAYRNLMPGGALIVVEKVLGSTADLDELMVDLYQRHKIERGYTRDEVDRKALALEGVLVPVTARWNEEMIRAAGFEQVDCFWRWMNFAAWVAVKEERDPEWRDR